MSRIPLLNKKIMEMTYQEMIWTQMLISEDDDDYDMNVSNETMDGNLNKVKTQNEKLYNDVDPRCNTMLSNY